MASPLSASEEAAYKRIIDGLLAVADLNTVTRKKIREGLESALGRDLSAQKSAIKTLIESRFDAISAKDPDIVTSPPTHATSAPTNHIKREANGYHKAEEEEDEDIQRGMNREYRVSLGSPQSHPDATTGKKRKYPHESDAHANEQKHKRAATSTSPSDDEDDDSGVKSEEEDEEDADAKLAAMLQAEENQLARGRSTRGGGMGSAKKSKSKGKKDKKSKFKKHKSSDKVRDADDSDLVNSDDEEGDGKTKRKPGGGFNKAFNLSYQLATLVGAEQLSRPQVVKKLWEHIKANDLQDPSDRRQIRCDEALHAVFGQSKINMFSMNKLLGNHLYPIDE